MHVLVAGCGWLGTAVASALVARGDRVTGVRRNPVRAAELERLGVTSLALDLAAPGAAESIPAVDAVVACQAAGGDGAEAYRRAYLDANRTLLVAAARSRAHALVYTGSTGVFGQRDGSDVEEDTPPAPSGPSGSVLAEAERLVREGSGGGLRSMVVRLSGLYGPGRAGLLDRVRSGRHALGPGDQAWMNFCERDDAVAFVLAALERGEAGVVYHGSDAGPARKREVVEWVSGKLGIPPPRTEATPPPGPDRRILSEWTRKQLGVELRYPSFREGLLRLIT